MPSETAVEGKRSLFSGFSRFKSKDKTHQKKDADKVVEDLERSLTKDDPLIESNTFNGELDDESRKNSKNKLREEATAALNDGDEDENKENAVLGQTVVDQRKQRRITWSSDVMVFQEQERRTSSPQSVGGKKARAVTTSSSPDFQRREVARGGVRRFIPSVSSFKTSPKNSERDAAVTAQPTADQRASSSLFAAGGFAANAPDIADLNCSDAFESAVPGSEHPSERNLSGSFEKLKNMLFVKLHVPRLGADSRRRFSAPERRSDSYFDKASSDSRSATNRSLHMSDLGASSEVSKEEEEPSLFFQTSRHSDIDLKKDSADKTQDVPTADEDAPVVQQRKKRRVPKLKLPGFRKKSKKTIDSETEALASAADDAGPDEPAASEKDTEAEDGAATSGAAALDDTQGETNNEDSEAGPSQPTPMPRTLPQPTLVETAQGEVDGTHDESQAPGDDVKPTPVKKKRRRKRGPRRPVPTLPEDETEEPEGSEIPMLGDDEPSTSANQDDEPNVAADNLESTVASDDQQVARSTRRARRRKKAKAAREDDGMALGVTVHKCDHLRANFKYISHPVVQVSVVDGSTGQYLQKSDNSRSVTSFYESDDVTNIQPIMTQPFDFRANQSILPRWEETLVFNESYRSLMESCKPPDPTPDAAPQNPTALQPVNPRVVQPSPMLFFVIRDFVSMTKANNVRQGKDDVDKGWHNVAWAFLKLIGSNGQPNTGRRVRLQLYQPPRHQATNTIETQEQTEPVYFWWRDNMRQPYQSTLYVTLKAVNRPGLMDPSTRSMLATQPEGGSDVHIRFADGTATEQEEKPKWSRLPGQACKIPNVVALRLWSGSDGAFSIRFSNGGTRLAVACKHENSYPILLYGIPGGGEMGCLNGHQQLVYDIQWSKNDDRVISASSDGTAQVWDLKDKSKATHTLPHPAYVYTAAFHPNAQHIVATGGYDCAVRVWNISTPTAQMLQELVGHKAFVNSLAFDQSGLTMYSVDSGGLVLAWSCMAHEKPRKNLKTSWTMKSKYEERELNGVCINNIEVHPRNNRLLLHCRDSITRMLDVRIHTLTRYTGSVNHRQHLRSALTACGSFVISGSEDGCVYVWNSDTGDQVAIFNELGFSRSVRDVTFHPHDHMVAFCCFSPNMPVLVFKYDKSVAAVGAGLINVVQSSKSDPNTQADRGAERSTSKVQRIKQQLDTVLPSDEATTDNPWSLARTTIPLSKAARAFAGDRTFEASSRGASPHRARSPGPGPFLSPRRYDSFGASDLTWGSTFDSAQSSTVEPSFFSPHASPGARALAQHLAGNQPKTDTAQGWRPTFTSVGGSPYRYSPGPDVTVAIDDQGNKSLLVRSTAPVQDGQTVVALYDYRANRSDELTIQKNDVIKVLYKDGDSWWFGEMLADGRQGYFPSNYVAANDDETVDEKLELRDRRPEVMFGVPDERPESAESDTTKTIHALKMLNGKVQFYSHSESDGDESKRLASTSLSSRQRRRELRSSVKETDAVHREPSANDSEPNASTSLDSARTPQKKPRKKSPRQDKEKRLARALPPLAPPKELSSSSKMEIIDAIEEESVEEASVAPDQRLSSSMQRVKFEDGEDLYTLPQSSSKQGNTPSVAKAADPEPASWQDDSVYPSPRPRFGVLQAVKQKLAENDSHLSKTVVGGSDFSRDDTVRVSRGPLPGSLDPILTSTATKGKKSRSRQKRSTSRGRSRPKVLVTRPSNDDDDEIPMVEYGGVPLTSGTENPAYDETSEV